MKKNHKKAKTNKKRTSETKASKTKVSKNKYYKVDSIPTPEALRKRGITGAADNIPPGYELQIDVGLFIAYFGKDILKEYDKRYRSDD